MPRVVVMDERNGALKADGSNIDTPDVRGSLITMVDSYILVSVTEDGVYVKKGTGEVSLMRTKSEAQMSAEKAQRDLAARGAQVHEFNPDDNAEMIERLRRAWEGPSNSGTAEVKGV